MQSAALDDVSIHYEWHGDGPPLVLLPGAGHLSNLDAPRAFEAQLLAFLAD